MLVRMIQTWSPPSGPRRRLLGRRVVIATCEQYDSPLVRLCVCALFAGFSLMASSVAAAPSQRSGHVRVPVRVLAKSTASDTTMAFDGSRTTVFWDYDGGSRIYAADYGSSGWSPPRVIASAGTDRLYRFATAVAADGTTVVAWLQTANRRRWRNQRLFVRERPRGGTWSQAMGLQPSICGTDGPFVNSAPDGSIVVGCGDPTLSFFHRTGPSTWEPTPPTTRAAGDAVQTYQSEGSGFFATWQSGEGVLGLPFPRLRLRGAPPTSLAVRGQIVDGVQDRGGNAGAILVTNGRSLTILSVGAVRPLDHPPSSRQRP